MSTKLQKKIFCPNYIIWGIQRQVGAGRGSTGRLALMVLEDICFVSKTKSSYKNDWTMFKTLNGSNVIFKKTSKTLFVYESYWTILFSHNLNLPV